MDYEKAYKEALAKCKAYIDDAQKRWSEEFCKATEEVFFEIFPELKEPEDEKISREITEFILTHRIDEPNDIEDTNSWLAWLEKQGEPINASVITRDDEILQAISIGLTDVVEDAGWSDFGGIPIEEIQSWLEKQGEQKPIFNADDWYVSKVDGKIHNIYNSGVELKFKVGDIIIKSQNSDINKFGQFTITDITGGKYWYNGRIICDISEQDEWELVEQKSTKWTEKDEENLTIVKGYLEGFEDIMEEISALINWLNSLKQRMEEQQ